MPLPVEKKRDHDSWDLAWDVLLLIAEPIYWYLCDLFFSVSAQLQVFKTPKCHISIGLHLLCRYIRLLSFFVFLLPTTEAHVQYRSDSEALYNMICRPPIMYDTI